MKRLIVVLSALTALASATPPTHASGHHPDRSVLQTVRTLERGYVRVMGQLSSRGTQRTAYEVVNPFPLSPFAPRPDTSVQWHLVPLDTDRTVLCVIKTAASAKEWTAALNALSRAGLDAAEPVTCAQKPRFGYPPDVFPAAIAGMKILNRREVPIPTYVPPDLQFDGVDTGAVTNPGIVLCPLLTQSYHAIVVSNPALDGDGKVGGKWGVRSLETSTGFAATHNCAEVNRNQLCTIRLTYDPQHGDNKPGSLWVNFLNGSHAAISLLGRTLSLEDESLCARAVAKPPKTASQIR